MNFLSALALLLICLIWLFIYNCRRACKRPQTPTCDRCGRETHSLHSGLCASCYLSE